MESEATTAFVAAPYFTATEKNRFRQPIAADLSVATPTVTADDNNATVLEVFNRHRDLSSLPVLEDGRPLGLINRNIFLSQITKPFHREVYAKKNCIAFMDKEPLIVQANTSIEDLAFLAVESGEKAMADGFVIVDRGQFVGLGFGLELMRMVADLQAEKNRQIMHSIDYASVIQRAMLSNSREAIANALTDTCLIWQPRDIVGGDFYHFQSFEHGWFAAVADCTGHGVPGAFLTMISSSMLTQAIDQLGPRDPALLMATVNRKIKKALGQSGERSAQSESDDGLDAAFFYFDRVERRLSFAGAKTPLFLLLPNDEGVQVLDGDRKGLGYVGTPLDTVWANKSITLPVGAMLVATTDGIVDQIGGPKNIAFGKRRIRDTLIAHRNASLSSFAEALLAQLDFYRGEQPRRDDVTLFGVRVD